MAILNKIILFSATILAGSLVFAEAMNLPLAYDSVAKHPDVVEKVNEVSLKGLDIDLILAEDNYKINFSTQSKLPIFYDVDDSRLGGVEDSYLNGVITLKKTIYDFGAVEHKVSAEETRKKALELEHKQVYEHTLQKLLKTANDINRLNTLIVNLEQTASTAKRSIEQIKFRFTSGIGTIMSVRQAQLLLLDLETETETLRRDLNAKFAILRDEFKIPSTQLVYLQDVIKCFEDKLRENAQDVKHTLKNNTLDYQRSEALIRLEKQALKSQIENLQAENKPRIEVYITAVVFDVLKGFNQYEVYSGVNLTMPLYDGGLGDSRQSILSYQIKVQNDLMRALYQSKSLMLNNLIKQYQELEIEHNSATLTTNNLSEKLSQIEQRLAVVDDGLLTKLQTQLQLAKAERMLLAYPFYLSAMNIDYWALNEKLLDKMDFQPSL